jgi:uncharacterized protein (TIGR02594 family)
MTEPTWLAAARAQLGVRETPGPKSTPKILEMAKKVGRALGIAYADDSVPWCGVLAAYAVASAGLTPPPIAVRAKAWATWGEPVKPMLGAVLVFERQGGGHVGFYVGEDATAYHVLGGNQSDAVTIARIAKDRCVAVRWPSGYPQTKPVLLTASGKLSTNEA